VNPFTTPTDLRDDNASIYAAAACAGMVDLFEAASASQGTKHDTTGELYATHAALAVCNGDDQQPPCPILATCLADTLAWERSQVQEAIWSVRGGMTEAQRRALRRQRRHD